LSRQSGATSRHHHPRADDTRVYHLHVGHVFLLGAQTDGRFTAHYIDLPFDIVEIILRAGDAVKKPYEDTPLDFVGIERWSWCLYWSYWMNILRKFKIVFATKKRPLDKVPDDNFLPPSRGALIVLFLIHAMYGTVLLCGWNFTFPTSIEQILWRIAILTVMATIILSWAIDRYTFYLHPIFKQYWYRCWPMCGPKSQAEERPESMIIGFLDSLRNNSPGRDPDFYVPLKALLPITVAGACYCLARGYIILEDLINLRALPVSGFATVNWSQTIPHLWYNLYLTCVQTEYLEKIHSFCFQAKRFPESIVT